MSFSGELWDILGRITEARDEAEDDEAPGEVCSVRIVVPCARQALYIHPCQFIRIGGRNGMQLTREVERSRKPFAC